jgi:DNA polymerase-3 subunit beta
VKKFLIDRDEMLRRVRVVGAVVPSSSPKPILESFLFTDEHLVGNSLEVSVRFPWPEGVTVDGGFCCNAKRLRGIVDAVSAEELSFAMSKSGILTVEARGAKFTLHTAAPDEFPGWSEGDWTCACKVSRDVLMVAIKRTVMASDDESGRFALGGVQFKTSHAGELRLTGTDGRRLSTVMISVESGGDDEYGGVVVPAKALGVWLNILNVAKANSSVLLSWGDKSASLVCDGVESVTRLVEGRFPNADDVLGLFNKPQPAARVSAGPFLAAVRQASVTSSNDSRGIKVCFEGNQVSLGNETAEIGSSDVRLPAEVLATGLEGEAIAINVKLDHRYLRDWLGVCDPAEVLGVYQDHVSGGNNPGPLGFADGEFRYIIMPMGD